jgi:hypothetical protein
MPPITTIRETWATGDRDSPVLFRGIEPRLSALFQMEGANGYDEQEVLRVSGAQISRPRRWHKIFERMGLLARSGQRTLVTALGRAIQRADRDLEPQRRSLAQIALPVLSRYQLKNPADETGDEQYPADCDIHPYWAMLKVADSLDGRLHWDELNRELFRVLKHADLPEVIDRLQAARREADYDPRQGGSAAIRLRDRVYDVGDDDIRDHHATPWFRRAGLGGLLFVNPGGTGSGYWSIPEDLRDLVRGSVAVVPAFRAFDNEEDWLRYLGAGGVAGASGQPTQPSPRGQNLIFFGPPGVGKSYAVAELTAGADVHRTVFHPEYSNGDFVGVYKPVSGHLPSETMIAADGITARPRTVIYYDFEPGVFARALVAASLEPERHVVLVIEEINRGDCAAIFGDVFQLLDRTPSGKSQFGIKVHPALGAFLRDKGLVANADDTVYLPSNLSMFATMNTSDQSLFPMDAAFKRRWEWRAVPLETGAGQLLSVVTKRSDGQDDVGWLDLVRRINSKVLELQLSEDKRIGPWYISPQNGSISAPDVRNKLLFYLWHDVFRGRLEHVFRPSLKAFDQAQEMFDGGGVRDVLSPLFPPNDASGPGSVASAASAPATVAAPSVVPNGSPPDAVTP